MSTKFGHDCDHRDLNGGDQWRFKFDNGYGASVIRSPYSYGGNLGLYELAVTNHKGGLHYDTPITDDVLGRLEHDEVSPILDAIAALPEREKRSVGNGGDTWFAEGES